MQGPQYSPGILSALSASTAAYGRLSQPPFFRCRSTYSDLFKTDGRIECNKIDSRPVPGGEGFAFVVPFTGVAKTHLQILQSKVFSRYQG